MAGYERDDANQAGVLSDLAYSTYLTRRLRHEVFEPELFGEPAWDILLLLFSNSDHSGQLPIADIARELQVTRTLAERWLSVLEGHALVSLSGGFAELTDKGRDKLRIYLRRQIGSLMQMLQTADKAMQPQAKREKG
jgi:DNA-binding MarR family transcriptional regulator